MTYRRHGSARLNALVTEAGKQCRARGYNPKLFRGMQHDYGTLGAMKKLFISGNIETGLERCLELGLRQHTLEMIAQKCPDEFSPAELECAKFKLRIAEMNRRRRRP